MRNIFMMFILIAVGGNAAAELVSIGNYVNGKDFVDTSTILKSGNLVRIWTLFDYDNNHPPMTIGNEKPCGSLKTQHEFDCYNDKNRVTRAICYDGKMGNGPVLRDFRESLTWIDSGLMRISKPKLLEMACGKQ